jgi:ankyrin repeat protein
MTALLAARANVAAVCNAGRTPLFYASSADIATMLLDAGADVNAVDSSEISPIFVAQNAGVARVLLDANADCNQRSGDDGRTPLSLACYYGLADVVKLLISEGADVNARDDFGTTALIAAVAKGHLAVVELLLARSTAMTNARQVDGVTALLVAVKGSFPRVVDALIAAGADVNISTVNGVTPLMMAKDGEMAQRLLDVGADITATINGLNMLVLATKQNHVDVMRVLLQAPSAPVGWINSLNNGFTALMTATSKGFTAAVELLIEYGANVDLKHRGMTALVMSSSVDIARLLWNAGTQDARLHDEACALRNAYQTKNRALVEFLLQCGFDINATENTVSLLMDIARSGCLDALRDILAGNPDLDQGDVIGVTALAYSTMRINPLPTATKMLLDAGADPRATDIMGFSPLYRCKSAEAIAMLVDAAPDLLQHRSEDGAQSLTHMTALPAIEELFKSSARHNIQIDVNHRDNVGSTALHHHVFKLGRAGDGDTKLLTVKLLLEKGADVFAVDRGGATVLTELLRLGNNPGDGDLSETDEVANMALQTILDHILSLDIANESISVPVPVPASTHEMTGSTVYAAEDSDHNVEEEPAAKRQRM